LIFALAGRDTHCNNLLLLLYKIHAEMPVHHFLIMSQWYGYYGGVLEKQ